MVRFLHYSHSPRPHFLFSLFFTFSTYDCYCYVYSYLSRRLSTTTAYDFALRRQAFLAAHALGFPKGTLKEGAYAWVAGPTYENPIEQRFLRAAGADVVGMSTVPEVRFLLPSSLPRSPLTFVIISSHTLAPFPFQVIAARHCGLRVLVLSLVTNIVVSAPYRYAEAAVEAELAGKSADGIAAAGAAGETVVKEEEVANHQEVRLRYFLPSISSLPFPFPSLP
jgi:purine-nucleoside phosphorylase